jgi:hypothetical protein
LDAVVRVQQLCNVFPLRTPSLLDALDPLPHS